tara:strand:+ start:1349 stop:1561 length:213 start_codon:yes stop_codon:yes gene_type:complete
MKNKMINVLIMISKTFIRLTLLIDFLFIAVKNFIELNKIFLYLFLLNKYINNGTDTNGKIHKYKDVIKLI